MGWLAGWLAWLTVGHACMGVCLLSSLLALLLMQQVGTLPSRWAPCWSRPASRPGPGPHRSEGRRQTHRYHTQWARYIKSMMVLACRQQCMAW